jgi:hypothetical protein
MKSPIFLLILFYFYIVQASVHSSFASNAGAQVGFTKTTKFWDDSKNTNLLEGQYPSITSVVYDGKDITDWFISYFLQYSQHGRLNVDVVKVMKNTFRQNSNPGLSGEITYTVSRFFQKVAKFEQNQPVTFPEFGSFPLIDKVFYGVPGNDIDMTAWFKNYFMQNQVGGRLVNHPINFDSIYGDPKFENNFELTFLKA